MKKNSNAPLAIKPFDPETFEYASTARVRYVGFEGIDGGRCLSFSVKSLAHDWVDIKVEISDASFTTTSGISIQDAAPMAYEKLVQLVATEEAPESNKL